MADQNPREVALKVLYDVEQKGAYSNLSLSGALETGALSEMDRGFVTELVYGTIKWKLTLDHVIAQFSSIKLKKLSPWIHNILRLGVYQLLYTDRIPVSAACNESVKLAKRYGHEASSRFVNGVLRSIARDREKISYPDRRKDEAEYLAIRYSHPKPLVEEWLRRYGAEFTEALLKSNNEVPEMTIRVNRLKMTKEELTTQLESEGVEPEHGAWVDAAIRMRNPKPLSRMEAFKNGGFQVQDESSMLVGEVLNPLPGETILDVCSAPGGKSTHIAEKMKNQGRVIARDIHPHKIRIIEQSAQRLGISIIETEIFDAASVDETFLQKADGVLVDAPCSGLGILRRKPDIKWARTLEDKKEIIALQKKILSASAQYVRPGGRLVYSTCTLEPEENQEIVEAFVKEHPEFIMEDITDLLPQGLRKETAGNGYVQLYPHVDHVDGFFISRIRRSE